MSHYTVEINKRPLISFDDSIVSRISDQKLGISVGDELIKINDESVETISKSIQYAFKDMLQIFYDQKLPFVATFKHGYNAKATTTNEEVNIQQSEETVENTVVFRNSKSLEYHDEFNDDEISDSEGQSPSELIEKYMIQTRSKNKNVFFDKATKTASNQKICLLSSTGLQSDKIHEWTIEILKCDVHTAEIGVISLNPSNIDNIQVDDNGIIKTKAFGARVVYGSELCTSSVYYGSYNADGERRCFRDLSKKHKIGWCTKVCCFICRLCVFKLFISGYYHDEIELD